MKTQKTVKEIINYLKNLNTYAPVSAIISCYNNQETIENTILSVAHQSWRPRELILVDDASEDRTLEIINKTKEKIDSDWIKVIVLSVNQGPSIARNKGWDNSAQPYVAFLDADDIWNKDKIAIQMYYMLENKDIAVSAHKYLRHKRKKEYDFSTFALSKIPIKEIVARKWLFHNYYSTPGVIIKRDLPYRFEPFKNYSEDYLLWLCFAFDGYRLMFLDLPLAYGDKLYFAEKGLSKNLWKMEKTELQNFLYLFKQKKISFLKTCLAFYWSLIRHVRKVIIIYFWKAFLSLSEKYKTAKEKLNS